MKNNKKILAIISGILIASLCAFEISEVSRFVSMIAGENSAYMGELVIKSIFILSLFSSGILFIINKTGRITTVLLTIAGGASVYKTFAYITGILGNEMIFGIVFGNIIDMLEIVLFIIPASIVLLTRENITRKAIRVCLIAEIFAFVISITGKMTAFAGWGKNFSHIPLFFDVYGLDVLRSIVCLLAFSLAVLCFAPDKRKKRR